jgi:nitric oxide synthase-interacting protein
MGKGQRHSKNAGSMGSETLSYAERRALGFGTVRERVGRDSQGRYDDCALSLQRAVDPVVTPDGYIFSREAILTNLLAQKKAIRRKTAAWAAAQEADAARASDRAEVAREAALIAFDRTNHMGISQKTADSIAAAVTERAEAEAGGGAGLHSVAGTQEYGDRMKARRRRCCRCRCCHSGLACCRLPPAAPRALYPPPASVAPPAA